MATFEVLSLMLLTKCFFIWEEWLREDINGSKCKRRN